jgi:exopolysaccharide production protein ExoQ
VPPEIVTHQGERREGTASAILPFIVGFYFAFRVSIVLLSVRILGLDPQAGSGINLALNFTLLLSVVFCCSGQVCYPLTRMTRLASIRWVVLFLGFSCLSFAWSNAASLSASFAYWGGMAADIGIVAFMLRARSVTTVVDSLMEGFVWGACLVAAIAWIMPAQSDLRLGDEEFMGANPIGYLCGFAFFFAQYLMRERKGRFVVHSLFLAVTLLRTLSKTTIVAFLFSQGFLLISDKSISRKNKILLALSATVVIASFWGLLASYFDIYSNASSQSETLTGRLGIWAYLLAEAIQQPWIGHGFDSIWKVVPPFGPDQFEAGHAHNELLQQFYAYGLVGICMVTGIYFSLYTQIRRLAKGSLKTFLLAFLLFVLVHGGAEAGRFDLSLPTWTIILLSLLIDHNRADKETKAVMARHRFSIAVPSVIGRRQQMTE